MKMLLKLSTFMIVIYTASGIGGDKDISLQEAQKQVAKRYIIDLQKGDYKDITQLFAQDGFVVSTSKGKVNAKDFFYSFLPNIVRAKTELNQTFISDKEPNRISARFHFTFKLNDGEEGGGEYIDEFVFSPILKNWRQYICLRTLNLKTKAIQINFYSKKIEYRYIVAALYALVLFLDRLDLTIVNITLPTLAKYFNVPITYTEWINNAFLLALAISIPISGWAGDRFGDKRVFIIATTIFGLSSLFCAFSPNLIFMSCLRFLQGLGGGLIIPVGMTMVYRAFSSAEYASVTSFIFIPTLIAPAIAPSLGGIIIHFFDWKWIFLFAVPICFLAVILSVVVLKEYKIEKNHALDWKGFFFSSLALILILCFISSLGKQGIDWQTASILLAAIIFGYLFLTHEKSTEFPLIDIKFFKNKLFLQVNLTQLAFQICHFGAIFLLGIYLQVGVGMSALFAGIIMGMQAIGAICTSRYSVKLFHQYGPGLPIIVGFIGVALITPCILLINDPNIIYPGAAILFIRGLFSGLCGTPMQTSSIIGFDKGDVSRASAVFNAGRQISISLGIALSTLLITYGYKSTGLNIALPISHPSKAVFVYAIMLIPIISLLGIFVAAKINNKEVIALISK